MKEKEIERLTKLKEIEEKIYNSKEVKYICGIVEAGRENKTISGCRKQFRYGRK